MTPFLIVSQQTCTQQVNSANNGRCQADAFQNEDGSYTVRGYFCDLEYEDDGYPQFRNCAILTEPD